MRQRTDLHDPRAGLVRVNCAEWCHCGEEWDIVYYLDYALGSNIYTPVASRYA